MLGAAVGDALLVAGYRVTLVGRATPLTQVSMQTQADPSTYPIGSTSEPTYLGGLDLSDPPQAVEAVKRAMNAMGAIHVLVNAAGAFKMALTSIDSLDLWDELYQANLKTCLNSCAAALPHLSPGARIINIGAASADHASASTGAYTAAKSSVARLTESLAEQLRSRHITVNALLPSIIDTPENRRWMPSADYSVTAVQPESIAEVILFLASTASRAITGALIPVTNAL